MPGFVWDIHVFFRVFVVNRLRSPHFLKQGLTFPDPDVISTPPGSTSGLLALDGNG
jgi:hypothetical protein